MKKTDLIPGAWNVLRRLALPMMGGAAMSDGADRAHNMTYGEHLSVPTRVGVGLLGAAGLRRPSSSLPGMVSRQAVIPSLATGWMERGQKRTYGASMLDPQSVIDKVSEKSNEAIGRLESRAKVTQAQPVAGSGLPEVKFQPDIHQLAAERAKAYLASRRG